MTMTNSKFSVLLTSLLLCLIACTVVGEGPQSIAKEAFEQWSEEAGIPYEDVRYETLSDDGTFATVRVTAFFAESPEAGWREMQADVECRKVAGKWQCDEYLYFTLSEAEQQRIVEQQNATATAVMATQLAEQATATADYQRMVRATETAQAGATATVESAIATETAAAIDQHLGELYDEANKALALQDFWLAAYYFSQIHAIQPNYRDAKNLLDQMEPHIGHVVFQTHGEGGIYIMDGLGRGRTYVDEGSKPRLSPDGSKIAFIRGQQIHVGPVLGEHPVVYTLPDQVDYENFMNMAWSPDGRRIAFALVGPYAGGVYVLDLDTLQVTQPFPAGEYYYGATSVDWHPSADRLSVRLWRADPPWITINADGSDVVGMPALAQTYSSCHWSPDGEQILVDGGPLLVVDADGSNVVRLLSSDGLPIEVDRSSAYGWSPDGDKIMYADSPGLWVTNEDGSYQIQIAQGAYRPRGHWGH